MKKTLLLVGLMLFVSLCFAQVPGGPTWVTFERTSPTTGTVRWSAEPSEYVALYYISLASTDRIYNPPFGGSEEPPWNSGLLPGYDGPLENWIESPGVYKFDHPLVLDPAKDYIAYVAANNSNWAWNASSSFHNPPIITLPVELSSFTAVLAAQNYVTLQWVTQSETNLLGYRLFRSENQNLTDAIMITPTMIQATNTTTASTYTHEDHEVTANATYWYWLESVDVQGSTLHGPSSVRISDSPNTPAMPEVTEIRNIYPNPFKTGRTVTFDVAVKEGNTAEAMIYNVRGQVVRAMNLDAGSHQLTWDGKDMSGNTCSSGMYYFQLNSSSSNQTRKLVLIK